MSVLEQILQEIVKERNKCIEETRKQTDPVQTALCKMKRKGLDIATDIVLTHYSNSDGWIPCSPDALPDGEALACDRKGNYLIGYVGSDPNNDEEYICESNECVMYDTVAWQPLPKAYNPEEEKKE